MTPDRFRVWFIVSLTTPISVGLCQLQARQSPPGMFHLMHFSKELHHIFGSASPSQLSICWGGVKSGRPQPSSKRIS